MLDFWRWLFAANEGRTRSWSNVDDVLKGGLPLQLLFCCLRALLHFWFLCNIFHCYRRRQLLCCLPITFLNFGCSRPHRLLVRGFDLVTVRPVVGPVETLIILVIQDLNMWLLRFLSLW